MGFEDQRGRNDALGMTGAKSRPSSIEPVSGATWGLHEAPTGDSSGLLNLIRRRVVGDAALVAESIYPH